MLLRLRGSLARAVHVRVGVVQLDGREPGVLQPAVERGDREGDDVRLVRLERTRDGETRGGVPVQNVHEFGLLERADHEGAALGVRHQVLPGDDAAHAALPERLLVHLPERAGFGVVLQNHDASGVAPEREVISIGAGQPERRQAPDDAEHLRGEHRHGLAVLIGTQELEGLVPRDHDLVRLGRGEVPDDRAVDAPALLQGEIIQEHRPTASLYAVRERPSRPAGEAARFSKGSSARSAESRARSPRRRAWILAPRPFSIAVTRAIFDGSARDRGQAERAFGCEVCSPAARWL